MSRDKIKQAALELFQRYSYVKTSVADIAAAAGMGKGTIYLSFAAKEDILRALLEDSIGEVRRQHDPVLRDSSVTLDRKVELFAQDILEQHFAIRDLMFGSFENVEGRELQDVYLRFADFIDQAADCMVDFVALHGHATTPERRVAAKEFLLFLSGRIVIYILSHDWNNRTEITALMPVWARQIFHSLVLQERS